MDIKYKIAPKVSKSTDGKKVQSQKVTCALVSKSADGKKVQSQKVTCALRLRLKLGS